MPFAHRRDAQIWRDQEGTGDPILLIMGHACGPDMWHRAAPELLDSQILALAPTWMSAEEAPAIGLSAIRR